MIRRCFYSVSLLWASVVVFSALALALILVVRTTDLLPGEGALARWMVDQSGSPGELWAGPMDFIASAKTAPIVFGVLLFTVWLLWGRYPAAVFGVAGLLTGATKLPEFASRPRPTHDIQWAETFSGSSGFPSHHVIFAVLVFGTLAYLSSRYIESTVLRRSVIGLSVGLALLMGPGRIVDREHWPADVLGGYLIAMPLLLSLIWLSGKFVPRSSGPASRRPNR